MGVYESKEAQSCKWSNSNVRFLCQRQCALFICLFLPAKVTYNSNRYTWATKRCDRHIVLEMNIFCTPFLPFAHQMSLGGCAVRFHMPLPCSQGSCTGGSEVLYITTPSSVHVSVLLKLLKIHSLSLPPKKNCTQVLSHCEGILNPSLGEFCSRCNYDHSERSINCIGLVVVLKLSMKCLVGYFANLFLIKWLEIWSLASMYSEQPRVTF